ncbi:MATE family efflux transporter [Thermococcus aggregans]|uniref:MATE family efflux transporter n=1 Tax=Thermococcus aggregans TaxID=110163 RepID=A0A9E7MY02_THEAG|nr:MATE family efflux transporter [Thermococcus aggregans]USS40910.1 MATE family efflux transporter [Thermococcus aggregans]
MVRVDKMREEILEGDIEKTLFRLAWPLILNNLVQVLYNITDTFWLGKIGREALSAPGVSWPLIGTLMNLGQGFAVAGFAFVGQYVGAKLYEKANRAAGALYSLLLLFASITAVIGFIITPKALEFMKVTPNVYPYALTYVRIIFVGIPFSFIGFAFSALMRAAGDTRTPVKINMFTVFLNVILDPILIFGLFGLPKLGVAGAAIATVLSNTLGSIIGTYLLFTGRTPVQLSLRDLKPDFDFYKRIFKVGLPAGVGQSANSFGFVILTRIIFGFGDVTYAAYTITTRLVNFLTSISRGISMAMGTMIAQNVGAENYERAKKIAERTMIVNVIIATTAVVVIGVLRVPIFRIFLDDDAVIKESAIVWKYFLTSVPFFNGIFVVVNNVFRASGHTKKSMMLGILRLWGLRIPFSYILGYLIFGSSIGVFLGMGLSNAIAGLFALAWFLRGTWMRRIID